MTIKLNSSVPFILYFLIVVILFIVALTGCYTQRIATPEPVVYDVEFYYPFYYPFYTYYPHNHYYYHGYYDYYKYDGHKYKLEPPKKDDKKNNKSNNERNKDNQDLRNQNGTRKR